MSVARITELSCGSTKGFEDAIRLGLARANKTLRNVRGAWVKDQEVTLDGDGKISEYRVHMMVTFVLEDAVASTNGAAHGRAIAPAVAARARTGARTRMSRRWPPPSPDSERSRARLPLSGRGTSRVLKKSLR